MKLTYGVYIKTYIYKVKLLTFILEINMQFSIGLKLIMWISTVRLYILATIQPIYKYTRTETYYRNMGNNSETQSIISLFAACMFKKMYLLLSVVA